MNKTLKSIISGVLACTMIASLALPSVVAFADEETTKEIEYDYTAIRYDLTAEGYLGGELILNGNKEYKIEKTVYDQTGAISDRTIYVDITWDDPNFSYDFGTVSKYNWNFETRQYDAIEYKYLNGKEAAWNKDTINVTFSNRSNRPVFSSVEFTKNDQTDIYDNVTVAPDAERVRIESAVAKTKAPTGKISLKVSGTPDEKMRALKDNEIPIMGYLNFIIEADLTEEYDPNVVCDHNYVLDQFGRSVCTKCDEILECSCIDEDEDGLCDECGLETDFCVDCHRSHCICN